jgi:hypothetical protein
MSYNKNQPDALTSQIYSWNETLHVSESSSVYHQEFFTVHTTMVYVIMKFYKWVKGTFIYTRKMQFKF